MPLASRLPAVARFIRAAARRYAVVHCTRILLSAEGLSSKLRCDWAHVRLCVGDQCCTNPRLPFFTLLPFSLHSHNFPLGQSQIADTTVKISDPVTSLGACVTKGQIRRVGMAGAACHMPNKAACQHLRRSLSLQIKDANVRTSFRLLFLFCFMCQKHTCREANISRHTSAS